MGGDCSVMGRFAVAQLGNKSYTPTIISVGSTTNLLLEMDSLEKQCTAIDEYIEKINTSIEFLQERRGTANILTQIRKRIFHLR